MLVEMHEVKKLRDRIQKEIAHHVQGQIDVFYELSQVSIRAVHIFLADVRKIGSSDQRFVVAEVRCELDI